jgi:hypothetical protein
VRTLALLLSICPFVQDPPKLPVPQPEAMKRAEGLVRDVFKDEFARKDAPGRRALGRFLLKQGRETTDDPAVRFVLFREAADIAADSADLKTALEAIDQLSLLYAVNGRETRKSALARARKAPLAPEDSAAAYDAYVRIATDEIDAEDYDAAVATLKEAEGVAEKLKNIGLVTRARAKSKEAAELKKDASGIVAARKTLAAKPDDPDAATAVGRYTCFRKGDWTAGLPLLAKGSDAALKALAAKDLADPSAVADQVTLGDGWWDLSEKESGPAREELRKRAAFWYARAAPQLTGLTKAKVEKRLGSVDSRPPGALDLLSLIDLKQDLLKGTWRRVDRDLQAPALGQGLVQIPYVPPEEYDLRLVVRLSQSAEVNLGIALGDLLFVVAVDGWGGKFSGVELIDGKSFDVNETSRPGRFLKPDEPNTILCSIRKNRVRLEVNAEVLVDWAMDPKRLSLLTYWNRPRNGTLSIGSHGGYTLSRYELVPITGQGKPLR